MDAYNGIDPKVINRAVLYIILCVINIVSVTMGYFEDFLAEGFDYADVSYLFTDLGLSFIILLLIYAIINGNRKAYILSILLIILDMSLFIGYFFNGISHAFVIVSSVLCMVILLTNPIRGLCIGKKQEIQPDDY